MIVLANSASHGTDFKKGPIRTLPRKKNGKMASLSQATVGLDEQPAKAYN